MGKKMRNTKQAHGENGKENERSQGKNISKKKKDVRKREKMGGVLVLSLVEGKGGPVKKWPGCPAWANPAQTPPKLMVELNLGGKIWVSLLGRRHHDFSHRETLRGGKTLPIRDGKRWRGTPGEKEKGRVNGEREKKKKN